MSEKKICFAAPLLILRRPNQLHRIVRGTCEGRGKELRLAWVAQLVERVLGKDEVSGSIPVPGASLSCVLRGGTQGSRKGRGGNSAVESRPSKPVVAGSNPVPRSKRS